MGQPQLVWETHPGASAPSHREEFLPNITSNPVLWQWGAIPPRPVTPGPLPKSLSTSPLLLEGAPRSPWSFPFSRLNNPSSPSLAPYHPSLVQLWNGTDPCPGAQSRGSCASSSAHRGCQAGYPGNCVVPCVRFPLQPQQGAWNTPHHPRNRSRLMAVALACGSQMFSGAWILVDMAVDRSPSHQGGKVVGKRIWPLLDEI